MINNGIDKISLAILINAPPKALNNPPKNDEDSFGLISSLISTPIISNIVFFIANTDSDIFSLSNSKSCKCFNCIAIKVNKDVAIKVNNNPAMAGPRIGDANITNAPIVITAAT